ncbi:pirin family protein [Massilia sp. YIM B04103]|uniref:pirin family protein n=1 Tax=Massilia sp. YIM B04103 TaxID=2963106 RepID=UPI002109135F|nr:pirin family protein [Massilia sp. YIM B04103]
MNAVLKPAARQIRYRSQGSQRSWFTRLASPSDVGEMIKPFVFLDDFDMESRGGPRAGLHPHSGIATVTVVRSGTIDYVDTSGASGQFGAGGVEWMKAGGGIWHGGSAAPGQRVQGFQLWLALPRAEENGPSESLYLAPGQIPSDGPARVVIGQYGQARSPLQYAAPLNYLHVKLKAGESWSYQPPAGHQVAWVALASGKLHVSDAVLGKEIAVFEESEAALDFYAEHDTEFVLGSAAKHPHELVLGYYSVHSSAAALRRGEARIQELGRQLRLAQ